MDTESTTLAATTRSSASGPARTAAPPTRSDTDADDHGQLGR